MKRICASRRLGRAAKAALFLFVCFFAACLIAAAAVQKEPVEAVLLEGAASDAKVLLFEERDGVVWLVNGGLEGTLFLKLDGATGQVLARKEFETVLDWAALRGDTLYGKADGEEGVRLFCWDGETLELLSHRELPVSQVDLVFFDCDETGRAFAVENGSRDILRAFQPDGSEKTERFPEELTFLALDGESQLFLCAGETLMTAARGEELEEVPGAGKPAVLLGQNRWIDGDGVVWKQEEQGFQTLFRLEGMVFPSYFCCLDGENCLILSSGNGEIRRYDETGGFGGSQTVEGIHRGLCPSGALTEKDGAFYYVPLRFEGPSISAALSPEPTLAPTFSPEPAPASEAPAWAEGEYLVAPAGTTAGEIRELLKPEAADVRDVEGNPISWGRLSTGMTVNSWTVVVPGDCDGSGTVTGADVRRAMEIAEEDAACASCFRCAADTDNDGVIDTGDLARLSNLISEE